MPHPAPMIKIASWNIRGLNNPSKQEDVKIFLKTSNVGLVAFLETKVSLPNLAEVVHRKCLGWDWTHNAETNKRGRLLICWKPIHYQFQALHRTNQLIHGEVTQLVTKKRFYITFVYGFNHEDQRIPLWEDITNISASMDDP